MTMNSGALGKAKEIFDNCGHFDTCNSICGECFDRALEAERQAGARQALEEFIPKNDEVTSNMIQHFKEEARQAALEEAAEIVYDIDCNCRCDSAHDSVCPSYRANLSAAIRAKAKENYEA